MATATFIPSRYWSFFAPLLTAYRRWRYRKLRSCVCGEIQFEPDIDPEVFIARGQYRGAVLAARLQLENAIGELFSRSKSARQDRIHFKSTTAPKRVGYLVKVGSFQPEFRSQFQSAYGRASRVVHGQHCPKQRAVSIVNEVRGVLAALTKYERPFSKVVPNEPTRAPRKVVTGFAAGIVGPAGVAAHVKRVQPMPARYMERTSDDQLAIDEARAERVLEGGAV